MKMQTVVIAVTGRSGLLAHTHPGLTLGQEFVHREWIEQTNHQADPPIKAIGSLFGGLPSSMRVQQTVRRDYVFFGTCDTPWGVSTRRPSTFRTSSSSCKSPIAGPLTGRTS